MSFYIVFVGRESCLFQGFSIETTMILYLENNDRRKCCRGKQAVSPNDTGILISTFNGSHVTEQ